MCLCSFFGQAYERVACLAWACLAGIVTLTASTTVASAATSIEFTSVPPYGSFSNLQGNVHGVNPTNFRVAVFIYVTDGWWSKPNCVSGLIALTTIQSDGTWAADITTGGVDQDATTIAAYLVPASFSLPCVQGDPCLSDTLLQQSVANTVATRVATGTRALHWSGFDWWVKTSASPVGPGPNYFSDSTNNISVDAQGRLHLYITHTNGAWQCAELVSQRTLGYGTYTFRVDGSAASLDPNIVLGMFTWSNYTNQNDREMDFEYTRVGNAADSNDAQFVVQPYYLPSRLVRYRIPPEATNSTASMNWQPNVVAFLCTTGATTVTTVPTNQLLNAGFESGTGTVANNWTEFGNAYRTATNDIGSQFIALSGTYSLKTYGPFGAALGASGAFQDITNGVSPGQSWQFTGFLLNWSGDPLAGPDGYGVAQLIFLDATNGFLQVNQSPQFGAGTALDQWQAFAVTATAPPGTVAVRIFMMHLGKTGGTGSVWWDNLVLSAGPNPNTIAQWTTTTGIPSSCDENVRLNLWLVQGNPPSNGLETEVVISKFEFQGTDTDGDGMPDWWERAHGLNPNDATDAAKDDDGDGFTNLQEYLAGTDPADSASAFKITGINIVGTNTSITFSTALDKSYAIETATNLPTANWTTVTQNMAGVGSNLLVIVPTAATNTPRHYRARLMP